MGKKEKPNKKIRQPVKVQQAPSMQKKTESGITIRNFRRKELLFALIAIVTTLIVYIPSLSNDFIVNWDDGGYILEHELVHKISWENFKTIFNPTTFYKGNYHPLTTFSWALEYALAGEKALLYHMDNLLLHLLNVLLVFIFIRQLSKRAEIAAFVALLFGVHPMHIESVAWITERKDVLYTFFFMLSLIQYFYYITRDKPKRRYYILAFIFFFLSMLSKSAAVCLPVVMFVVDYYFKRKFSFRLILEKTPFFVLALIFGIIAVFSQSEKGAIQDLTPMFTVFERLLIVCHSLMTYLWKLFVPIRLAAMYPYPARVDGLFPAVYFAAPFVVLMFIALLIYSKKFGRHYIFGALFFFVTIALVIQIVPVGGASMAERYAYVPYIGLFFMLGKLYDTVIQSRSAKLKNVKPLLHIIVAAFIIFFSLLTWQRIGKWKNGEVLMRDLSRVYPYLPFAYNNLGYFYYHWEKNNDKALREFNTAIQMDSTYYQAWANRGIIYNNIGKHQEAIADFDVCLQLHPDDNDGLIGKANSLSALLRFEDALPYYDRYLHVKPRDANAVLKRGTAYVQLGRYDEAFRDFEQSRKLKPDNYELCYWYGIAYYKTENYQKSLENLDKSIELNPKKSELYSWRGLARYKLKQLDAAIADYNTAIQMNPDDAAAYVNRSVANFDNGNYLQAWEDINTAGRMRYPLDRQYFLKLETMVMKLPK
ncbi:MAG TPA: tetratricopeptide repeat protein [Bacteroidales bacterium]|mgnify:CR=1 FL=1|nr:tetratricopeptide repeat protein [Bacteroidales bacterium]